MMRKKKTMTDALHSQLLIILVVVTSSTGDELPCPKGSQVSWSNLHCYWLSESSSTWSEARDVCSTQGGSLAAVDGPEVKNTIKRSFSMKSSLWVWVRRSESDGSDQEGEPAGCSLMLLGSVVRWRETQCSSVHRYVCGKKILESAPSTEGFLVGLLHMTGVYDEEQIEPLTVTPDSGLVKVEMQLFPGLWFSHAGQLTAVELVVQPGPLSSLARIQILRPYCSPNHHLVPPGCSSLSNSFSCCSAVPLCNTTGGCGSGMYWCHLLEGCIPTSAPCSPYVTSAVNRGFKLPPRYPAIPPFYHLAADLPLKVEPLSDLTTVKVRLPERAIFVYPDDIVAVQHTRDPGSFMHCLDRNASTDSQWRQSYLSLRGAEWDGWWPRGLTSMPSGGQWVDGVVCNLRMLYVDSLHGSTGHEDIFGLAQTETTPLGRNPNPGSDTFGLHVILPVPDGNNRIHVQVNVPVVIVAKILSGEKAKCSWSAPVLQNGLSFLPSCPTTVSGCRRESESEQFSSVTLTVKSEGVQTLNILARSDLVTQSTSVDICSYVAVTGLKVIPGSHLRVIVDVPQSFTAEVDGGTSVRFSWVIDNLEMFASEGESYSVVLKKPAVYKLKVTASNPISSEIREIILDADEPTPFTEPELILRDMVALNETNLYILQVKADMSLPVTVRWIFGDDSDLIVHNLPAQSEASEELEEINLVTVKDSVNHTYSSTGNFTIQVQVANQYETIQRSSRIDVRLRLHHVHMSCTPLHPTIGEPVLMESVTEPIMDNVIYTWNFSDNTEGVNVTQSQVTHIFSSPGAYNVTVLANNTLTVRAAWLLVAVVERISGLSISHSGPNELNSVSEFQAGVVTGTGLIWSFDFGDGFVQSKLMDGSTSHVYDSPGRYEVRVTVSNNVSKAHQLIVIEVYRLAISGLQPVGCVMTDVSVELTALVNGNTSVLVFHWMFADKTPLSVVSGSPTVRHMFTREGLFPVNITVVSPVTSTSHTYEVCVETPISKIELQPSRNLGKVDEEICFRVLLIPEMISSCQFKWTTSSPTETSVTDHLEKCFAFSEEGDVVVSVTASNRVSNKTANASVSILTSVGQLSVGHGSKTNTMLVNASVSFWAATCSGSNVSFVWDFGDGASSKHSINVSHIFTSIGEFTVSITAANAVSQDSATLKVIVVSPDLDLSLQLSQPYPVVREEILITAVSYGINGVTYRWTVDGSSIVHQRTHQLRFSFPLPGLHEVKVVAEGFEKAQEATLLVEVTEGIEHLKIDCYNLTEKKFIPTQQEVLFVASAVEGSNVTYQWLATQFNPQKEMTGTGGMFRVLVRFPGEVTIQLRASNKLGETSVSMSVVAVEPVSKAQMAALPNIVALNRHLSISVSVFTGSDLEYVWYVCGDPSPLRTSVPHLLFSFKSLGHCSVTVSVKNVLSQSNDTKVFVVQETVEGVDYKIDGKKPPFYVGQSADVLFQEVHHKGSSLHFMWNVSGAACYNETSQNLTHSFSEEGLYPVSLNVSNGISWQVSLHLVTVQQRIEGLVLNISKSTICTQEQVQFVPSISEGSNVTFILTFGKKDWFYTQVVVGGHYNTSGLATGIYQVNVTAHNQVSSAQVSSVIVVVERIKGLKFLNDIPDTLSALQTVVFQADADRDNVDYMWLFRSEDASTWLKGQEVTYTPQANGSLTLTAFASNGVCTSQLDTSTRVEWPVQGVKIVCQTERIFVGYNVTFSAEINRGDNLKYIWHFGALTDGLATQLNSVNHTFLVAGKHYVVVNVSNSVSSVSAQLNFEVEDLKCSAPRVFLIQSQITVFMSQRSFFEANVEANCTAYKSEHQWKISTNTDCTRGRNLRDATSPLLVLPSHFLDVGQYCLIFTVSLQGTPLLVQREVNVSVVHSPLVAFIKGGSARVWPHLRDLVLDGSDSMDPDVKPGERNELQFLWTCVIQNTTTPCSENHQIGDNKAVLIISSSLLHPGTVYIFSLTVLSAGRKSTSATQMVTVIDVPVLPVTVQCKSCSRTRDDSSIILSGQCGQCDDNTQYKWIAVDRTGLTLDLEDTDTSSNLVIHAHVLQPGLDYTFTLNASEPWSGRWGSASLRLTPRNVPYGGRCEISPASDSRLLESGITVTCSGWQADTEGSQLIYALQVIPCERVSPQCPLLTLYRSTCPVFRSLMPFGSRFEGRNESVMKVILLVEDSQGQRVTALNRTLTVSTNRTDSTEWLGDKTRTGLWTLVQHGNPQEIITYAAALTSRLNQIDSGESVDERTRRKEIRRNVTQALASLPISSLMDVDQISSALAQCTAVPGELERGSFQTTVLQMVKKMLLVMKNQSAAGVLLTTGQNVLSVLGNSMAAVSQSNLASNPRPDLSLSAATDITLEALDSATDLVRSLVHTDELLSLSTSYIRAVGFLGHPSELLCTGPTNASRQIRGSSSTSALLHPDQCPFKIPTSLTTSLTNKTSEVVQVFFHLDEVLRSHLLPSNLTMSTSLVAMELSTPQGELVPIHDLDLEDSIELMLPNKLPFVAGDGRKYEHLSETCLTITLPPEGQLDFLMRSMDDLDENAGLYISFNFSLIPAAAPVISGRVTMNISSSLPHNHSSQEVFGEEWTLSLSSASDFEEKTIFLSPILKQTDKPLTVNLTSILDGGPVNMTVCVFSSVCRFYDRKERRWSTEGLLPLEGSTLHRAHCLTQHLTMFGATLFVHPGAVVLLPPSDGPVQNMVVGLVCFVLLLVHCVVGLIAHKLDHLESLRLSQVPLCGRPGLFHYRVLVKTGWRRGAGTSAHVGISLCGQNKSGSRHLKRHRAFLSGSLDHFHVETDDDLGELWKIRIWHDNTGLDPAWFLQHVVVWDLQTDYMYFFLVDDWLSVEHVKNGSVEKEVLASCPAEITRFGRLLTSQLLFGMMERHLWLSLWTRPAHSRFSRSQRVTCGALSLHLYLALAALWFGAVSSEGSSGPVSAQLLFNMETVAMGMTTAVMVLPVQCLLCFIFRRVCSKVIMDKSAPSSPLCHSVLMDVHLDRSEFSGPSFLSLPDSSAGCRDTPSSTLESKAVNSSILDFWAASGLMPQSGDGPIGAQDKCWSSCDSLLSVPAGLSHQLAQVPDTSPSPAAAPAKQLKRKKAVYMNDHNMDTFLSLSAEEDLLMTIAAETEEPVKTVNSDSGRDSPRTTSSLSRSTSCSSWSNDSDEKLLDEAHVCTSPPKTHPSKRGSVASTDSMASTVLPSPSPDSEQFSSTRIGLARGQPGWLLPSWTLCVIYLLVALVLGGCLAAVGLYGRTFNQKVVLMWLVSAASALLTSALLLEPLKLCLQALAHALLRRTVDPEVEDQLSLETTVVRAFGEDVEKVRPPCGYGLLQAKEEARKVQALKSLMRHSVGQLMFLLLVLMVNYQDYVEQRQGRMLHSFTQRQLRSGVPNLAFIRDWSEAGRWINTTLISHLHHQSSLRLAGSPRLLYTPMLGPEEIVLLGNSSAASHRILNDLQKDDWNKLAALSVDFTHYHRESGLFLCVSIHMEYTLIQRVTSSFSIYPLIIPAALSGPDLHVALTLILLISGVLMLLAELWRPSTERAQYLLCGIQVSLAVMTSLSQLCYLLLAESCLSQLGKEGDIHIDFLRPALVAQFSSQCAALLLTLLLLKLLGTLRFVQRWVVIGRVLRRAWGELRVLTVLLLLLMLLCVQLRHVLFQSSAEDFPSLPRTFVSVLSMMRGRVHLRRLCRERPVLGPVYALLVFGGTFWLLSRLCGAILCSSYRSVRASLRCPNIEPQDYEMVEFFIKRLKLWIGLTKAKEFRHRVKFEGMSSSRSSQESRLTTLSSSFLSSSSPRPPSSSLSVRSEDSSASEQGFNVSSYLEHLQPCFETLLSRLDRVNQSVEDVLHLEVQLEDAFKRRKSRRRETEESSGNSTEPKEEVKKTAEVRRRRTGLLYPRVHPSSSFSFLSSLPSPAASSSSFSRARSSYSGSESVRLRLHTRSDTDVFKPSHRSHNAQPAASPKIDRLPRRRAWHSGSSHSADAAQRMFQSGVAHFSGDGDTYSCSGIRRKSEERTNESVSEGLPRKRKAWISEAPETDDAL